MSLKMNYFMILLTICASTEVHHEIHFIYACFESGDPEVGMNVDGDEVFYGFFNSNVVDVVWTLPIYPPIEINQIQKLLALEYVTNSKPWCKENLAWGQMAQTKIPKIKEAPECTIYTRERVKLGENNTLICFVNNFFPPPVKIYWKKNSMEMTEGTSLSRYYPNKDGTFHQFSTLSFTPEEGDIYACIVEHTTLEDPKSYFWEHEDSEVIVSSAGSSVFCGVGLSLGLLGVATGTFLMVKRSKGN